jgi:CHAT domain-containing protein
MKVQPPSKADSLVLEIFQDESASLFRFTLRHPGTNTFLPMQKMSVSPKTRAQLQLCLSQLVRDPQDRVESDRFSRLGELLYLLLLPGEVRKQIEKHEGPLIITSSETTLPWELLHNGQTFLCLQKPMARQTVIDRNFLYEQLATSVREPTNRALIVADPCGDLGHAQIEAARLTELWQTRGIEVDRLVGPAHATWENISHHLARQSYAIIHVSSHAEYLEEEMTSALVLEGDSRLVAPTMGELFRGTPVVFLNACHSHSTRGHDGGVADASANIVPTLVDAFIVGNHRGRAQAVIGTSWWVVDEVAKDLAIDFYTHLLAGESLGQSLLKARQTIHNESNEPVFWAPYVLYGDPSMALERLSQPRRDPHPPVPGDGPHGKHAPSSQGTTATSTSKHGEGLDLGQDARELLLKAVAEMRSMNSPGLSTVHLLLGATHLESGILHGALVEKGLPPRQLRRAVRSILRQVATSSDGFGAVSKNVIAIVRLAAKLAREERAICVGERHLLSALLGIEDSGGIMILRDLFDFDLDDLRLRIAPQPCPSGEAVSTGAGAAQSATGPDPSSHDSNASDFSHGSTRDMKKEPPWSQQALRQLEQLTGALHALAVETALRRGAAQVSERDLQLALRSLAASTAPIAESPAAAAPLGPRGQPPSEPRRHGVPHPAHGEMGSRPPSESMTAADPRPSTHVFLESGDLDPASFDSACLLALQETARLCIKLNWEEIRSPIVFLGLVATRPAAIDTLMARLEFPTAHVVAIFERFCQPREGTSVRPIRLHREFFSNNTIAIVKSARSLAGNKPISPLHLVLGCLAESTITHKLMESIKLSPERTAEEARRLLSDEVKPR